MRPLENSPSPFPDSPGRRKRRRKRKKNNPRYGESSTLERKQKENENTNQKFENPYNQAREVNEQKSMTPSEYSAIEPASPHQTVSSSDNFDTDLETSPIPQQRLLQPSMEFMQKQQDIRNKLSNENDTGYVFDDIENQNRNYGNSPEGEGGERRRRKKRRQRRGRNNVNEKGILSGLSSGINIFNYLRKHKSQLRIPKNRETNEPVVDVQEIDGDNRCQELSLGEVKMIQRKARKNLYQGFSMRNLVPNFSARLRRPTTPELKEPVVASPPMSPPKKIVNVPPVKGSDVVSPAYLESQDFTDRANSQENGRRPFCCCSFYVYCFMMLLAGGIALLVLFLEGKL